MLDAGSKARERRMRIHPPSRLRRIAKWVGLGVCFALFMTWGEVTDWSFRFWVDPYDVTVTEGKLYIDWGWRPLAIPSSLPDSVQPIPRDCGNKYPYVLPAKLYSPVSGHSVVLPFWLLFPLTYISTGILWYRDRRRILPGHCPTCGYNLTGNESGACPECATRVIRSEEAKA